MKLLLLAQALITATAFAAPPEFKPESTPRDLSEKIQNTSPNGKYALRIGYDRALNEQMLPKNPPPEGGIFSETIEGMAIVSLPGKEILQDMTKTVAASGNNFSDIKLLWADDSKWCAFYYAFPRTGYTTVFHLKGEKFELAHPPHELNVPTDDSVRNEYIAPVRWVKPGVLELSVERVLRGDAEEAGDGVTGFIARFDGKGKWKLVKKKRYAPPSKESDQ